MTLKIGEETLVAYLDGELPAEEAEAVESALGESPELAATADRLRRDAALLRGAFNEPLTEPVPERLVAALDGAIASSAAHGLRRTGPATRLTARPMMQALAASIVALVVGLAGAYVFAERQVDRQIARIEALRDADRALRVATREKALETKVSGEALAWTNPDSGSRGRIEPVRTFKASGGQWCREYREVVELQSGPSVTERLRGVACREGDGVWRTRLSMPQDS